MTHYSPRVNAALATVDEQAYTLTPHGTLLTQTTSADLIASTLEGLDVHEGMRVLEIGTGSGYSGALLSELVGPTGTVVSLDVVPELAERARALHTRADRTNVALLARDGHRGAPEHGPFDRVVAWTTPEALPHAWVEQSRPGALVVAPVEVAGLVKTHAVVTAEVTSAEGLAGRSVARGGYVEMHGPDLDQWSVPTRGLDVLVQDGRGAARWMAGPWAQQNPGRAERLLARLAEAEPGPMDVFEDGEDPGAFRAWLYAAHPGELATVGGPEGFGIGYVDRSGVFLFHPYGSSGPDAIGDRATAAEAVGRGWVEQWRREGRPGWSRLRPVLRRGAQGWQVRVEPPTGGRCV